MCEDMRIRADAALVSRSLTSSRERAQALIEAGLVYANGQKVKKSSQKVDENTVLEVRGECCPYVSRGGFKLEKALKSFGANVEDAVCVDVGASTGGFTDVLLQNGAAKVYAVDVGTGQLDPAIEANPRVVKMEQTNARALRPDMFNPVPTMAVMDVSFISVLKILPALRNVLGENGRVLSLIKPQFEAGREALGKKGVVSNASVHERVLRDIASAAPECGWRVRAFDFSPIAGTQGNLEFLADFIADDGKQPSIDSQSIKSLVKSAHEAVKKGRLI